MKDVKCTELLFDSIKSVDDTLSPQYRLSDERRKVLGEIAAMIDEGIDRGDWEYGYMKMSVPQLSIMLDCDFELELHHGSTHPFFSIVQYFDSLSFTKLAEDKLRVTLTINDVWGNSHDK